MDSRGPKIFTFRQLFADFGAGIEIFMIFFHKPLVRKRMKISKYQQKWYKGQKVKISENLRDRSENLRSRITEI